MDNQDNGISLGQLFSIVKKSLKRGLIYVLVSVIVLSAVLVLIKTFTSKNVYNATVSFSTTDDTILDDMKSYKANAVNKALNTDGKGLDISDEVVKNLSVSAVIPEEKEKDSAFIPTSFKVSLKTSSELKLSSGEYKSLVDNIAKEYVNQFAISSMPELLTGVNVDSQINLGAEYLQVAYYISDIIDYYLSNIESFAESYPASAGFFAVNGKNVTAAISDFSFIKSEIDNLKSTIVLNKYGKGNLSVYLSSAQIAAAAEVAKCQKVYDAATANVNAYKSTVEAITKDDNGNNIYTFNDSAFTKLTEQVTVAAKQLGTATEKKEKIDKAITIVDGAAGTTNEDIVPILKACGDNLSTAISNYSSLSKEFNSHKTLISDAKISKPANASAESFITSKIIIIADVAALIIAYMVAFSQTFAIMKKKGELN